MSQTAAHLVDHVIRLVPVRQWVLSLPIPLRDLLADLRQRNGAVNFSDHKNAYHGEMEHVLGDSPKWLKEDKRLMLLMGRVGVLDHVAHRPGSQGLAALTSQPEFNAARQAVERAVAELHEAVLDGDRAAATKALGGLKDPCSKMILRFG